MKLPKYFRVTYAGIDCDAEYELTNCYLARIKLPCCECHEQHYFYSQEVEHLSFDIDDVEYIEDAIATI